MSVTINYRTKTSCFYCRYYELY